LPRTFVQIGTRAGLRDPAAEEAMHALAESLPVASVRFVQGYVLEGLAPKPDGKRAAEEVLIDHVTQTGSIDGIPDGVPADATVVSVLRRAGVMDPVESSVRRALAAVGLPAESVRTVRRYVVRGSRGRIADADLVAVARERLANEAIEEIHVGADLDVTPVHPAKYQFRRVEVPLRDATDDDLVRISKDGALSLSLLEMQAIRAFFREEGREPTDAELETLAQTWSEHCKHKTLAGEVRFKGPGGDRSYKNLLKETVFQATKTIARDDCLSVFVDNAGVIAFDEQFGVCMKVETHNHPSAIEPYGGAGTGIGGVIRDVLGTGLGARPFLNTNVFCFAPPDTHDAKVPKGCLHPARLMHGVVEGVRDYGNRMGIPTASGGLFFDPRYVGNPIVYAGTLGIIPREMVKKAARPGDRIVVIGGRTGRDGIHGATFSSVELHEESETVSAGAVQIGNPIEEKMCLDALLRARDEGLLSAVTDCGAGGLSSAVGEMGGDIGAKVELAHVPLKYPGLSYAEIWISEAQERMVLAVAPANVARLRAICAEERVEITDLGEFTNDQRLRLTYGGAPVADLPMHFIHDGLPRTPRNAEFAPPPTKPFDWTSKPSAVDVEIFGRKTRVDLDRKLGDDLRAILSSWNVCSKEWVIRQYDHEVQAGTALKPLVGRKRDGPGDACVMTPVAGQPRGVAVSSGMNPRLGDLSPYDMAANAVDEALRNLCAVGANPRRAALLDNFSWGNCGKPDRLGSLVLAAEALRDVAVAYGTPFVSGKDSLNNEYMVDGRAIVIPPTLLVSAFCVVDDVRKCVSMDLKESGNLLFVVGVTRDEMGGSHLGLVRGVDGGVAPRVRTDEGLAVFDALHAAMSAGLVRACHDMSEGGLAVALAEMAFAGCLGVDASLVQVPFESETADVQDACLLFAESPSRFVVEVRAKDAAAFDAALRGVPHAQIGRVTTNDRVAIHGLRGSTAIDEPIDALREAFVAPLRKGAR
jgi:phosphoribosylformylglycinamidine synthase